MVLHGRQIQRRGLVGCTPLTHLALPNDIAGLPREGARLPTRACVHTGPAHPGIVQQNGPNKSAAIHQKRYHVARAGRHSGTDQASNGPRHEGGRYVLPIHHH
jgi:hypothetical protein